MEVAGHGPDGLNDSREADKVPANDAYTVHVHNLSEAPDKTSISDVYSVCTTSLVDTIQPETSVISTTTAMAVQDFSFPSLSNDLPQAHSISMPEQPSAPECEFKCAFDAKGENETIVETVQGHFSQQIEEDSQPVVPEELFDDMVVLEDGIVTVPASSGSTAELLDSSVALETVTGRLDIPDVPPEHPEVTSVDIRAEQPSGPTDGSPESTAPNIKQPENITFVTEVNGEGVGGDELQENETTVAMFDILPDKPSAVDDNHMPHGTTSDGIQHEECSTETATEQKIDRKLSLDELPSEKERELSYMTIGEQQNMEDIDTLKGENIDERVDKPQILTDALTEEMPETDSTIKQTQHTEEVADLELSKEEAEALIGRRVVKRFENHDFLGEITAYDTEEKWFKIVYEDLDEEDLEWVEIKSLLLSADVTKLPIRPKSAKKKREHTSTSKDGDERTPKKAKKHAAGMASGLKTPVSGKKASSSKKVTPASGKKASSSKKVTAGSKTKGSKSTTAKKHSSSKKSKKDKAKLPGSKDKQRGVDAESYKTPEKSSKEKAIKGKQMTARKSVTPRKSGKSIKKKDQGPRTPEPEEFEDEIDSFSKTERKRAKTSQLKSASQKQSGMKRKPDMDETRGSLGKRLKQVATANTPDVTELHSLHGHSLHEGKVEVGGRSLMGRNVRKKFGGRFYSGHVVSFDKKSSFYKVLYNDGDQEDLEWHELEPILTFEEGKSTPARPEPHGKKTPGRKKQGTQPSR